LGISSIQQQAAPVETKVFGSNEVQPCRCKWEKKRNLQLKKQWIVFLKEKITVEFSLAHTAHTAQLYPNPEMFSRPCLDTGFGAPRVTVWHSNFVFI
jgi:hypothetical protein